VGCSPVGVFIGLHDVELGAPVASDLICVTILERITCVVDCRHIDSVEGRDTAATYLAQVDVVGEEAAEQVRCEVVRGVDLWRLRKIHP